MPSVLLRPYFLSLKNKLWRRTERSRAWAHDIMVGVICLAIIYSVYSGMNTFLNDVSSIPDYRLHIPKKLVSLSLFGAFFLLFFSNLIACLSFFYSARDLPLLLTTPVSFLRLYLARATVAMTNSSWVLALFTAPIILSYQHTLELPFSFIPITVATMLIFLFIPTALCSIVATFFVNFVPVHRVKEAIGVMSLFILFISFFFLQETTPIDITLTQPQQATSMLNAILTTEDPTPLWMPSRWAAEIINAAMDPTIPLPVHSAFMLLAMCAASLSLGYACFNAFFLRGWTLSLRGTRSGKVQGSKLFSKFAAFLFSFNPQFRAMFAKEMRMFFRDPAQSVQLILLLGLTFVYLFNFKGLQRIVIGSNEAYAWWKTILCIANVSLGGCVAAAIATRFVYPSVSLEGQAYWVVRSAPITIKRFLYNKFWIWFFPMSALSILLLVSGAWAIHVSPAAVFICAILGVAMSAGVVGLAVGIGSVYARFDWDSPTQVAASFGSLVFMVLAIVIVLVTLIPSALLIILTSIPGVVRTLSHSDYLMLLACGTFLVFFINLSTARWALSAGYQALRQREA